MRPAADIQDFLANPYGRYYRGRRHIMYAASPTLIGFVVWGRPDADDVRDILQSCEIGLIPGCPPHRFLADVRALEFIDPITFGMFVEYTRKNRVTLARNIVRQAQLRPGGVIGAIIAGFSHLARLPYPEKVFDDVERGLEWLGVEQTEGIALLAELDELRESALMHHPIVERLRRMLEAHRDSTRGAPDPTVAVAARKLGVSARTLQRSLRDAGTTYRNELRALLIRQAQELLRGDRNLDWVAAELGFSSLQHFSTAFRRATGDTPTGWRARHRPAA